MDAGDLPAHGAFHMGFWLDGLGKDGLPLYREQEMIVIARPPQLLIDRPAEADDIVRYREQYEDFRRQQRNRKPREGYPLADWPAVSPLELRMCHDRDILTVEELAPLAKSRTTPPQLVDIARRAAQMIEMHQKTGGFEAQITELKTQIATLMAELREAHAQISAQNMMIAQLQTKAA